MPYITSYDRYQYKQGQRSIIFTQLQELFGDLLENFISDIKALSRPQLILLGLSVPEGVTKAPEKLYMYTV